LARTGNFTDGTESNDLLTSGLGRTSSVPDNILKKAKA
jgi:hypothetical protein